MDIDRLDYTSIRDMKDESIKDFIHETKVLQQVKDAGAKNINMFIEAVSIHSQLWLICEYCPGGSVKTLVSLPPFPNPRIYVSLLSDSFVFSVIIVSIEVCRS